MVTTGNELPPKWKRSHIARRQPTICTRRECLAGVKIIPDRQGVVSLEALHSLSESHNFISHEVVEALGWKVDYGSPPFRTLNRCPTHAGEIVIKPIGLVILLVQQKVSPFCWDSVMFHVLAEPLQGYPSNIIIGEADTKWLLGQDFSFEDFNNNRKFYESKLDYDEVQHQMQEMGNGAESQLVHDPMTQDYSFDHQPPAANWDDEYGLPKQEAGQSDGYLNQELGHQSWGISE